VTDRRETTEETDVVVSFADPDDAVRERVSELGLSTAARDLDETIRASKVADSNVADEVERHVRELVDEGDADAFQPAPEPVDTETVADRLTDEADATDETATDGGDTADSADDADAEDTTAAAAETDETTDSAPSEPPDEPRDASTDEGSVDRPAEQSGGSDGQSSMEDYL
jgi:hypothetical protein